MKSNYFLRKNFYCANNSTSMHCIKEMAEDEMPMDHAAPYNHLHCVYHYI